MRRNFGRVSLKKPKRMNIKIRAYWIYKGIVTIMYASLIYFASSRDTSSVPLPLHYDKAIHFIVFGLLSLMICWTLSSFTFGNHWIVKIIVAIGITSLYGASDEFHQVFTPHRSVSVFDWLADTAGAATAAFLWYGITSKWWVKKATV
ncbi:MAG: hypothetical protein DCC43_03740 [Candidatus Brocadia sp.]|nr:VanZ family protein [Candidatus Brocadia sp.]RIK02234.1 MAG: hypothetical protein DCC43_03740 [Candidatus Brocadia sp.]